MGLRGAKPQGKVRLRWSPEFAYAIGLLATDGSLSKDGRHFDFTSKDREQLENFLRCLGLKNKIGTKRSGYGKGKLYTHIQFGDVLFYRFLLNIGLTPAKSKTIGELRIPEKYFFDFLRGAFDGDGTFYSYWDPRWKSSFMFYTVFCSASKRHIDWIRNKLVQKLHIWGHINRDQKKTVYQLKYAKGESLKVLKKMYCGRKNIYLTRKRLKIGKALAIVGKE